MAARKMLSIIIALVIVVGVIFVLSFGILLTETEKDKVDESEVVEGLILISHNENAIEGHNIQQFILYDPDTLVMYVMLTKIDGTTMSVLYNADGTPKLYNPEKQ